jgi:hypothetical protein
MYFKTTKKTCNGKLSWQFKKLMVLKEQEIVVCKDDFQKI